MYKTGKSTDSGFRNVSQKLCQFQQNDCFNGGNKKDEFSNEENPSFLENYFTGCG